MKLENDINNSSCEPTTQNHQDQKFAHIWDTSVIKSVV